MAASLARLAPRLVKAEPAAQLAALRIVVPLMVLACPEVRAARALAAVPGALRVAPEGLGWFLRWVPIAPAVATAAQAACALAALCAACGVWARPCLAALTVAGFYLFALGQLGGAVWHDMHLLWLTALLAASPCDEALAFDRLGTAPPPDAPRFGAALAFARLLLACVYFFPGVHKLARSGLAWALSDNLRHQLYWKWAEHGAVGPWRVDRVPGLLEAVALFALAFELGFPALALARRTRPWAAAAGLAFHVGAGALLRLPFVSLWVFYPALLDPRALGRWWRPRAATAATAATAGGDDTAADPRVWRRTVVVGCALVLGAVVQGVRGQMRAFPFACYPTFEHVAGAEMPDLVIELEDVHGRRAVVSHARDARGDRTQRQWGEVWSLAGVTSPVDPVRLRAHLARLGRVRLAGAERARFYRVYRPVAPEAWGAPPRRARLIADLALRR